MSEQECTGGAGEAQKLEESGALGDLELTAGSAGDGAEVLVPTTLDGVVGGSSLKAAGGAGLRSGKEAVAGGEGGATGAAESVVGAGGFSW